MSPRKNPMKQPEDLPGFRFAVLQHQKAGAMKGRLVIAVYDDQEEKVLGWMAALPKSFGRDELEAVGLPKYAVTSHPEEWAWEIAKIHAWEDGWGPLMYEAMLVLLSQKGYSGWLFNDPHCTSEEARAVWKKFANRSDVEFVELPPEGHHPRFAMRALPALLEKRHKLVKKPDTDRERKKLVTKFLKAGFKEDNSYSSYKEERQNPMTTDTPSPVEVATVMKRLKVPKKLHVQFFKGFEVEWEHAHTVDYNLLTVGKIVLDHLNEDPKYYTHLSEVHRDNPMKRTMPSYSRKRLGRAVKTSKKSRRNPRSRRNPSNDYAIYVADLEAYNEGTLRGQWITPDSDPEVLAEQIQEVIAPREEWAIHDYDNFPNMGENPNIEDIATAAKLFEEHDAAVLWAASKLFQPQELEDVLEEGYGVYDSEKDYVYSFVDDMGGPSEVASSDWYFDYEAFGRDVRIEDPDYVEEIGLERASDRKVGEYIVDEFYGGIGDMPKKTVEMYFDYEAFGRDLMMDTAGVDSDGFFYVFNYR